MNFSDLQKFTEEKTSMKNKKKWIVLSVLIALLLIASIAVFEGWDYLRNQKSINKLMLKNKKK